MAFCGKMPSSPSSPSSLDFDSGAEDAYAISILQSDDTSSVSSFTSTTCPPKDNRGYAAKAFEDGMNSSDPQVLRNILSSLMEESCVFEVFRLECKGNVGKEEFENVMESREEIIQYFSGYIAAIPDMIFLVHEWRIFDRSRSQSCLVFKFSLTGNQIFRHEDKCNVDPESLQLLTDDERAHLVSHKRIHGPEHSEASSVQFNRQGMSSSARDRKKRTKTLGEFVDESKLCEHHRADLPTLRDEANAEIRAGYVVEDVPISATRQQSGLRPQSGRPKSGMGDRPMSGLGIRPTSASQRPMSAGVRPQSASKQSITLCSDLEELDRSTVVNIRGVMRFTFNDRFRVVKVHCVHFTPI